MHQVTHFLEKIYETECSTYFRAQSPDQIPDFRRMLSVKTFFAWIRILNLKQG